MPGVEQQQQPSSGAPTAQPVIAPPGDTLVLAHYMAWFQTPPVSRRWQHWNWDPDGEGGQDEQDHLPDRIRADGRPDLAAIHEPLIGAYDSSDPDLIEYQLALAWASGIEGFVIDWYGPQDREGIDLAVSRMFDKVAEWREQYGFRFFLTITYEEQILFQVEEGQAQQIAATSHFRYILEKYAAQTSYLRYQARPLIFYFEAWPEGRPGLLRPAQLAEIKRNLPPFYLIYMGAEAEFLEVSDGFFSWVSGTNENPEDWGGDYVNWVYDEMDFRTEEHNLTLNIGSVWAGFDDSQVWGWGDVPRYIDRQEGLVYAQTWEVAQRNKVEQAGNAPSWVQIVTWNDWNEGSEIEPSVEYGYQYLEATQRQVRSYSGRDLPPEALRIPKIIYHYDFVQRKGVSTP